MPEAPTTRGHDALEQAPARDAPTGELVHRLAEETSLLVRQELELARAELAEKARRAGLGAAGIGGAGVLGFMALATATVVVIAALALALPVWAAALIVTGGWALAAAVAALVGSRQLRRGVPPVPEQTVETVKEDVEWAGTLLRSARR